MNSNINPLSIANIETQIATIDQLFNQVQYNPNNRDYEHQILSKRTNFDHIACLIEYLKITSSGQSMHNTLRVAIELKNIVKVHYGEFAAIQNDNAHRLTSYIRESLLDIYLFSGISDKVIGLVFEAILICVKCDFPAKWIELIAKLVSALDDSQHERNYRVFNLVCKMTKKYEYESRSDELYAEIIEMVKGFHDKLLFYISGYINTILNGGPVISLKIVLKGLKVFYHFIYHDIHPYIEDNIPNWSGILKRILSPDFETKTQVHGPEAKQLVFLIKGEVVKILLLCSTKFKEDFKNYIDNFAEDIWRNCSMISSLGSNNDKVLINSIKYFKSFASNQSHFVFFEQNMKDVVAQLMIPGMQLDESEVGAFEEEPQHFVESLFGLTYMNNKTKSTVQEFIGVIAKFYRDKLLEVLQSIFTEILNARSLDQYQNEIVFLDIFMNAVVMSYNSERGAQKVNCPQAVIQGIYTSLVETFIKNFIDSYASIKNSIATMNNVFLLLCYHLKFINMFKYYLDPIHISGALATLATTSIDAPFLSYRKTLLQVYNSIMNMTGFEVVDKLNAPVDNASYYRRYYSNPQCVTIEFNTKVSLSDAFFQSPDVSSVIQALVIRLNELIVHDISFIDDHVVGCFKLLMTKTDIQKNDTLYMLYHSLVKLLTNLLRNDKLQLNYGMIDNIFEIIANFIRKTDSRPMTPTALTALQDDLLACFAKGHIELNNIIIQVFCVIVREYKPNILADPTYMGLLQSCINLQNYTNDFMCLFPAYFFYIIQCISTNNDILKLNLAAISACLDRLLDFQLFKAYYNFVKYLILNNLEVDFALSKCFEGLTKGMGMLNQQNVNYITFRLFKDFFESLLILVETKSFEILWSHLQKINQHVNFPQILKSDETRVFFTRFAAHPSRSFIILLMTKIVAQEVQFFEANNLFEEFKSIFNLLILNIYSRKTHLRNMLQTNQLKLQEKNLLDSLTNNLYSQMYRLSMMKQQPEAFIDHFVDDLRQSIQNVDEFVIDKVKELIQTKGIKVGDMLWVQDHTVVFN